MRLKKWRGGLGFTLIEMLVVIVVIFILMGVTVKVFPLIGRRAGVAKATYDLQQLRNALNAYYAEYGSYPPCNFTAYEYESKTHQTVYFSGTFLPAHNDPTDAANFFADQAHPEDALGYAATTGWYLGYRYGLVSFLYLRERSGGEQPHWYDRDTERDITVKNQWYHYIDDVGPNSMGLSGHASPPGLDFSAPYSNVVATIVDPWYTEYQYRCPPPHFRYKLWSAGPDKIDGTQDDLLASSE